jgi:hypothetical protein
VYDMNGYYELHILKEAKSSSMTSVVLASKNRNHYDVDSTCSLPLSKRSINFNQEDGN